MSLLSRADDLRERADQALGDRLDSLVLSHHRRRLRGSAGRSRSRRRRAAGPQATRPRRRGTRSTCSSTARTRCRRSPRRSTARAHVHLAGWFFSPASGWCDGRTRRLPSCWPRPPRGRGARARLGRRAAAAVPARARRTSARRSPGSGGTRRAGRADARERPLHCHHEKLVIVDDELAFVGGIDLTDLAGDRFDRSGHPARARSAGTTRPPLRGPAVGDVAAHFALRWREVTGEGSAGAAARRRPATLELQVVRTVPEHVYGACRGASSRSSRPTWRAARGASGSSTWRTSSSGRPRSSRCSRTSCATARRRLPARGVLPAQPEQRRRRHPRPARRPRRGRRRRRLLPRLHALPAGRRRRSRLRARQDRHRRRPLADDRLGEPERALAVQRHRDERRHATTPALHARRAPAALGEHLDCAPASSTATRRRIVDERWRPLAEEQLERRKRDSRRPTGCSGCRTSRAGRRACSARSTGFLVDG